MNARTRTFLFYQAHNAGRAGVRGIQVSFLKAFPREFTHEPQSTTQLITLQKQKRPHTAHTATRTIAARANAPCGPVRTFRTGPHDSLASSKVLRSDIDTSVLGIAMIRLPRLPVLAMIVDNEANFFC
jgi:hypothetical protein